MTVAMDVGWQVPEMYSNSSAKMSSSTSAKKHVWSEDPEKILSLMMGKPEQGRASTSPAGGMLPFQSEIVQLDHEQDVPLPSGWEKRLDLKSGSISFVNCSTGMSTFNDPRVRHTAAWLDPNSLDVNEIRSPPSLQIESPMSTLEEAQLDLELNLGCKSSSSQQLTSSSTSPPSQSVKDNQKRNSASPDLSERIIVTGCKGCLMYVMLSQKNPQCPRCGSYVVLDISQGPPLSKKSKA